MLSFTDCTVKYSPNFPVPHTQQTIPRLPAKQLYASDAITEHDFTQTTQTAAALDSPPFGPSDRISQAWHQAAATVSYTHLTLPTKA